MTDGRYPEDGDPYGPGAPDNGAAYEASVSYGSGGYPAYDASYGSGAYAATPGYETGYESGAYAATGYDSGAWSTGGYEASAYSQDAYANGQTDYSGAYGAVSYDGSGAYATPSYESGTYTAYDSGAYDTTAYASYDTNTYTGVPAQTSYETTEWSGDVMTAVQDPHQASAAWSADPWAPAADTATWSSAPAADLWNGSDNRLGADAFDGAGRNDAAAAWYDAPAAEQPGVYGDFAWSETEQWQSDDPGATQFITAVDGAEATVDIDPDADAAFIDEAYDDEAPDGGHGDGLPADDAEDDADDEGTVAFAAVSASAAAGAAVLSSAEAGSRAARRKTTRRSRPLKKVAGGSLALMGVAAVAVAAAGGIQAADKSPGDNTVAAGSDVPLASPLDQQFADLRDGAEDFADRASRAQTRVAVQERQEELARQQDEDRKKREALRPKYVLPVAPGLSAYFGQAGGRWSHLHTGIDFPVDRGTPVRAVTDGVVRTEINSAYGNMVILTAPDGTETWYCHLTRAKIASGPVKAGDVIAYSGNSGNSTGPHLHLEVRPDGGAPINPIPWLRERGLNPTG